MNLHNAATHLTSSYEQQHVADTTLHGRWLLLARIAWFALVIFTLGVYIASLLYRTPHCVSARCLLLRTTLA